MCINAAGLQIIKNFEGCKLEAYHDIAGILTIGYGHTGSHVVEGMTINQEQAEAQLVQDLAPWEKRISEEFPDLNENQFSALCSLCFNVGSGPLVGHLGDYLRDNDMEAAAGQFLVWCHSGGKTIPGLLRRREAERDLFLT